MSLKRGLSPERNGEAGVWGLRPCMHQTDCANNLHLGEELGRVDFSGRWTRIRSSEARRGSTPSPLLLFPRPPDSAQDLSQSSGTKSGLYWVARRAARVSREDA